MKKREAILAHLKRGCPITPMEALRFYGCFRLAAVIYELRQCGFIIHTEQMKVRKNTRIARYHLIKTPDNGEEK